MVRVCVRVCKPLQVMEYAKRGSLYSVLHDGPAPAADLRNRFAVETARGLAYLHDMSLIHRDIKSPNVLVTADWHAKIGDFGLAKVKTETKTATKSIATSVRWAAPECLDLEPEFTTASDVFSFGVLLYELATCKVRSCVFLVCIDVCCAGPLR